MTTISTPAEASSDHSLFTRLGFGAIILVFGGFGVWSALAPLDSAAVAPGRVAVEGERKPVQHLEGGIVREILVKDAQQVSEGDVLFRLDSTAPRANSDLLGKQMDAALALEARLMSEREGHATVVFPPALLARAGTPELATIMAEQQRFLAERRRSLDNQIEIFQTRIEQNGNDADGRSRRLGSLKTQLQSFVAEMDSVSPLVEKGYFARNKFRALERERARLEGEIGALEGDIARLSQVAEEARVQMRQLRQRAQEEQTQALTEVRARLSDLREKRAVAEDVLQRLQVRAPRSGVVLNVKVTSLGAVIAPGATLAEVVPPMQGLILIARVSPLNVQNITPGQKAEIRLTSFSSKTDPIFGIVETVSADAVVDERTRETFYQTRIVVDPANLPQEIAGKVVPGMPADILIITGERTLLTYLLAPLRNSVAKAMRDH
ncbi:hemolysin D [Bosea sp. AAP35]|uniref:HlyD family type I secretion periplasmic adaptor subunit n=1 Tax=Bosea sp. AAP35 TaxID=1523417 RepID=UPI0006B9CFCC|nr:HlyD family type I secretion periplasmic adaptor subunit [Bosea sp. AAP35]KPF71327.1 hemolysin D [Bosea sp. AAP35]